MKHVITSLFILSLLSACSSKGKIPPDVLNINTMKPIVWDMISTEQNIVASDPVRIDSFKLPLIAGYEKVFAVHKIDKNTFYKSFDFYEAHPDLLKVLMDSVSSYGMRKKAELYNRYK